MGLGGGGDSGLWNRGGHPRNTLTEMACLSGHTATGALLQQATASTPGGDSGPITYTLDDADQASSDFGVGDGAQPAAGN